MDVRRPELLLCVFVLALGACFHSPDPAWVRCMEGRAAACTPLVCESISWLPSGEIPPSCGIDADADVGPETVVADAWVDVPPDVGPLDPGSDTLACDESDPTVGPGKPELCDGKDNDCDGQTDEDLTAPSASMTSGVCFGQVKVCGGIGGWREPDYTRIAAYQQNETTAYCDAMDNDCDVIVDEGCPCDYFGKKQGVCGGGGAVSTVDGACVEPAGYESDEVGCDKLDNDCDSITDEGCCGSLGAPCPAGFTCTAAGTCESPGSNEVYVPAGSFWMGCNAVVDNECSDSETPQHLVQLPSFVIDRTEVTAAEYKACVQDGGACALPMQTDTSNATYDPPETQNHPINWVRWYDAENYCAWRAWETGVEWRLCTESEWEKAARGGCATTPCTIGDDTCCKEAIQKYPWGGAAPSCDSPALAVFDDGTPGCGTETTWPVESKPDGASPYGALDMAGNVWEWVQDWLHESYDGAPADGTAWVDPPGDRRIFRGGSYAVDAASVRASGRLHADPAGALPYVGLRCCRSFP